MGGEGRACVSFQISNRKWTHIIMYSIADKRLKTTNKVQLNGPVWLDFYFHYRKY